MTVQVLKLNGERFVLVREKDFRALKQRASTAKPKTTRRLSKQDLGDIAEARRRKAEGPSLPYSELRKKLGLA